MRHLLLVITLLAAAACKNDPPDIDGAFNNTLKATIDGEVRTSTVAAATLASPAGEVLQIEALFDVPLLVINIYSDNTSEPIVAGEYKFDGTQVSSVSVANCFYSLNDGTSPYGSVFMDQADVGKVTITELDRVNKTVSGTFEARVGRDNDVVKFEKGSFTKIPLRIN
jgi:hypothetical protein